MSFDRDDKFAGKNGFVWFTGVVEDINDPLKLGRLRVRIAGYHTENRTDIPVAALQWAYPMSPIQSAGTSGIGHTPFGPLEGSWVMGFFRDGFNCQDPVIIGTYASEITEEPNYGEGFSDPNKIYPRFGKTTTRGKYPVKTDINPLALSGMIEFTPMAWRRDTRIQTIQTAWPFSTVSEPESTWAPAYPKNHVRETESGHVVEFDDTPGKERIHEMHRSGTYREIRPDGTNVVRILGDDFEIILQDKNLAVQGNLNITVQGNVTMITNGDVEHRVKGDMNVAIDGDYNMTVKGGVHVKADKEINILSDDDIAILSEKTLFLAGEIASLMRTNGDLTIGATGDLSTIAGNLHHSVGEEVHHNSSKAPEMPGKITISDAIPERRTNIPSKLLDGSDPTDIKSKKNSGNTQNRVAHQTGNKY